MITTAPTPRLFPPQLSQDSLVVAGGAMVAWLPRLLPRARIKRFQLPSLALYHAPCAGDP